jgi:hypothetical protein
MAQGIYLPIVSEFKSGGIDKAVKEFKSLETAGQKANFALKKAALPAALALGAVTAAATKFVAAGEAAATSNARIEQINESMGLFGDSTEQVNKRLIKYAEATARATGVDQNSIKATQAKLLTFKELAESADDVNGAFDRATKAAIDLAAAGFGDAETNAVQLGKALNDPIKGITALAKSGVTFTQQEKDKIKTLVESNKILEAQEMVLSAIETQVGGTAEATANDSDKMKVAFSQLSESIGLLLLPLFNKMVEIMIPIAALAQEHAALFLTLGAVIAGVAATILAYNFYLKITKAFTIAATVAQASFNAVMAANPITLTIIAIAALVAGLIVLYKRFEFVRNVVDTVFNAIKTAVTTSIDFIKSYFEGVLNIYKALFNGIAKLWNNTIGRLSFEVPDWVPGLGGKGFSVPNIPVLDEGGIVSSPTLAMLSANSKPEAIIPLDKMNMGGTTVNIYSTIADATLPDKIVNALRVYNRRSGRIDIQVA